jgi:hypothetical protein
MTVGLGGASVPPFAFPSAPLPYSPPVLHDPATPGFILVASFSLSASFPSLSSGLETDADDIRHDLCTRFPLPPPRRAFDSTPPFLLVNGCLRIEMRNPPRRAQERLRWTPTKVGVGHAATAAETAILE